MSVLTTWPATKTEKKNGGPGHVTEFLGIILVTQRMEIRLSEEQMQALMNCLEQ